MTPLDTSAGTPLSGGDSSGGGPRGAVAVFARHWTPGQTKTRLAATIGDEAAARLSREFLSSTLRQLEGVAVSLTVRFTPREKRGDFEALTASISPAWSVAPQPEGDLGTRMRQVLTSMPGAVMIVGSDSPDLPAPVLQEALQWLAERSPRLVVGPTDDGGYRAIGCHGEPPPVFDNMPWGSETVLGETLARLEQAGWRRGVDYRLLSHWYDVDTADDLRLLHKRLQSPGPLSEHLAELRRSIEPYCASPPPL